MKYSFRRFAASEVYPNHPGSRATAPETSREAAISVVAIAKNHRDQILAVLKEEPFGLSSEQIASKIGLTRYAVRPRVSELYANGLVKRTEERARNDAGRSVVIWRAVSNG